MYDTMTGWMREIQNAYRILVRNPNREKMNSKTQHEMGISGSGLVQ
jgi:hypothetical protein